MSKELTELLNQLEDLLQDTENWRPLASLQVELRSNIEDMRLRLQRIHEPLVVAITGGTGVGKSTLFNALAGEEIAEVSPLRPHTGKPTVLHPEDLTISIKGLSEANYVARAFFKNIVLIDTPDWDSAKEEHWAAAQEVLGRCDLILLCAESEKYKVQKTWDILEPLKKQRGIVCVQTRVDRSDPAIWEDWKAFMISQGFEIHRYFEVNALNAWKRIMSIPDKTEGPEFQFEDLKSFLQESLSEKRNEIIKRSNVEEMLLQSTDRLYACLAVKNTLLKKKQKQLSTLKERFKADFMNVLESSYLSSRESLEKVLHEKTAEKISGLTALLFKTMLALKSIFNYFLVHNRENPVKWRLIKASESEQEEKTHAVSGEKLPQEMQQFLDHYQTQLSNILEEAEYPEARVEKLIVLDPDTLKDLHKSAGKMEEEKINHYGGKLSSIGCRLLFDFMPWATILLLVGFLVKYTLRWELLPVSAFVYFAVIFCVSLWVEYNILKKSIQWCSRRIRKTVVDEIARLVEEKEHFLSEHQALLAAAESTITKVKSLQEKAQVLIGNSGES